MSPVQHVLRAHAAKRARKLLAQRACELRAIPSAWLGITPRERVGIIRRELITYSRTLCILTERR